MRRWAMIALFMGGLAFGAVMIYSCNGSGKSATSEASPEGYWVLHIFQEDQLNEFYTGHLTITRTGSDLTAQFSCDDSMPLGYGTVSGDEMELTFDFGGDDLAVFTGDYDGTTYSGTFSDSSNTGTWYLEESVELDCSLACEPVVPVRFVDANFTDLNKITEVSLFRSGAGHDYSDFCEDCRSMKHYFTPYDTYRDNDLLEIYSPVDGTITAISAEQHGDTGDGINRQVHIRSSDQPDYTFVLFHTDLTAQADSLGKNVQSGELIGYARMYNESISEYSHDFDIAVRVSTSYGERYVSFFDVVTDTLFTDFASRGSTDRGDFIITADERDASPMTCDGETFTNSSAIADWFSLDPKVAGAPCQSNEECASNSCVTNACSP